VRAWILNSHGLPPESVNFTGIVQVRSLPLLLKQTKSELIFNSIED
jgi:hypothetical protein